MTDRVGRISLRAAIRGAFYTGSMMAMVGVAYPAMAEPSNACFADANPADASHLAELALPATQNLCIRNVREGRAAVQLPAAQQLLVENPAQPEGLRTRLPPLNLSPPLRLRQPR